MDCKIHGPFLTLNPIIEMNRALLGKILKTWGLVRKCEEPDRAWSKVLMIGVWDAREWGGLSVQRGIPRTCMGCPVRASGRNDSGETGVMHGRGGYSPTLRARGEW